MLGDGGVEAVELQRERAGVPSEVKGGMNRVFGAG